MSRKKTKSESNVGRKFVLFVKPIDEDGMVDESSCGWLSLSPSPHVEFSIKDAFQFTEREKGHGSFDDWKNMIEEDHPNWKISSPPRYLT